MSYYFVDMPNVVKGRQLHQHR